MTKYPNVPDDVMSAAVEACRKCLDEDKPVEWAAIYAILAERERCAMIAASGPVGGARIASQIRAGAGRCAS